MIMYDVVIDEMEVQKMIKVLAVRNERQKVLFEREIQGQLSDGQWENARPYNHWMEWCRDLKVIVDPDNVGRNFDADKDNYNLIDGGFLRAIGERMIALVAESGARIDDTVVGFTGYTMKHLKRDLADLKTIMRTRRMPKATDRVMSIGTTSTADSVEREDQIMACLHDDLDVLRQRAQLVQRDLSELRTRDGSGAPEAEDALLAQARFAAKDVDELLAEVAASGI